MHPLPNAATPDIPDQVRLLRADANNLRLAFVDVAPGSSADVGNSCAWPQNLIPPDFLDGYSFVREIHRGGQGVVYEAFQHATRRRVAIKLFTGIKPDSRAARRFEREAELITQLRHPNVVTVLDAGEQGGTFFLIMEYVDGVPIDQYVDSRLLRDANEVTDRRSGRRLREIAFIELLRLFERVCDGVAAAHLKGIIHRDLKPANILVDTEGQPRVLDFGLAKMAGETESSPQPSATSTSAAPDLIALSNASAPTCTLDGQFVGSLPWASPEQAAGDPANIDIRTDVYSLGVVLYQLLSGGRFPYEIKGTIREVRERIATAYPEPLRRSDAESLRRFPSDSAIEAIVLKCLSKNREHRYLSAGDLAADTQRYLAGEAVAARAGDWGYSATKFLNRNLRSIAIVGSLFGAILVLTWWDQERTKMKDQLAAIVLINQELDGLEHYNDTVERSEIKSLRAATLAQQIDGIHFDDPTTECQLRLRLAGHLHNVRHSDAPRQSQLALAAAKAIVPPRIDLMKEAIYGAIGNYDQGLSEGQEALFKEWLKLYEMQGELTEEEELERLGVLTMYLRPKKSFNDLDVAMEQLLQLQSRIAPEERGNTEKGYAECLCDDQGRLEEAYQHQEAALVWQRRYKAEKVADNLHSFGHLLIRMERYPEAVTRMRECVELRRAAFGHHHRDSFYLFASQSQYGEALTHIGEFVEAQKQLLDAFSGYQQRWSPRWIRYQREFMSITMQRLVTLYERWSEGSMGEQRTQLQDDAAAWRMRLEQSRLSP